jgi:hypothetical protein
MKNGCKILNGNLKVRPFGTRILNIYNALLDYQMDTSFMQYLSLLSYAELWQDSLRMSDYPVGNNSCLYVLQYSRKSITIEYNIRIRVVEKRRYGSQGDYKGKMKRIVGFTKVREEEKENKREIEKEASEEKI